MPSIQQLNCARTSIRWDRSDACPGDPLQGLRPRGGSAQQERKCTRTLAFALSRQARASVRPHDHGSRRVGTCLHFIAQLRRYFFAASSAQRQAWPSPPRVSLNHRDIWEARSPLPRRRMARWRREHNEERPKRALGGLTPAAYAKQLAEKMVTVTAGL